jgi:hypothetical protein
MIKKGAIIFMTLVMVFTLVACSTAQATQRNRAGNQSGFPTRSFTMPVESKLGYGILKLEGTSMAVTADQAGQLLPLWQKVKDLNTSGTPSPTDLDAVFKEIQGVLTGNQISAIDVMEPTQADMESLLESLGVKVTPGSFPNGGNFQGLSESERATQIARRQTEGPANDGGTPGQTRVPRARGTGQPSDFQGTPGPGQFGGASYFMNLLFVDPVLKLLEGRAG